MSSYVHYEGWLRTHTVNLKTLNRLALLREYRTLFHKESPRPDSESLLRTMLATKRAADSCRRSGYKVPSNVLAILSLMKERDYV